MPPVGQNRISGSGAATALSQRAPPDGSAGKQSSTAKPRPASVIASDTVAQPGSTGTAVSASASTSAGGVPGLTRNWAPASQARATSTGSVNVPTPAITSGTSAMMMRNASSAASVRNVTSITGKPPAASARASGTASATRSMVSTGMTGTVSSGVGSAGRITDIWARHRPPQARHPNRKRAGYL